MGKITFSELDRAINPIPVKCPECGEWFTTTGESNKGLCGNCIDDGFSECDYCEEIIKAGETKHTPDGEDNLCDDCWDSVYG